MRKSIKISVINDTDVTLHGSLTLITANEAVNAIETCMLYREKLVVNLNTVTDVDSASLAFLLEATRLAKQHSCEITFKNLSNSLQGLVKVAKLGSIVQLEK